MTRIVMACSLAFCLARSVAAQERCPDAQHIPQLTISEIENPAIPVIDPWQVLLKSVPLSDAQLAALAGRDSFIDLTREEMENRGGWVYVGLATAALGAIVSSAGWYLNGRNEGRPADEQLSLGLTLGMGLGGLVLGIGGVIMVTEAVQRPLEPHLAPTPTHRLTRAEARELVTAVNEKLYREVCQAVGQTEKKPMEPSTPNAGAVPVGGAEPDAGAVANDGQ